MGTRILTVEDDERIRTAVKLALEDEGWDVIETATGEEALDAFEAEPADVVLIDIMLPGIDGFELCRTLRRTSDVPVVREVCGGGATLVNPRDADALAGAIEAVALDGEAHELAAVAARDHAAAFTWQRTAERTVEAYRLASGSGLERLPLR